MQKTILIGRVGMDATINDVSNGKKVVNFSVCHSETYKDTIGVKHEKSQWFSCSYFTERLNIAQYIRKGDNIYVEGKVEATIYNDKLGKPQVQLKLIVSSIQLIGNSNNQSQGSSEQSFKQNLGDKKTDFNDEDSAPF